jgi:ketosteroid isomerase-like protein
MEALSLLSGPIWHCHPWLLDPGTPCRDDEQYRYFIIAIIHQKSQKITKYRTFKDTDGIISLC